MDWTASRFFFLLSLAQPPEFCSSLICLYGIKQKKFAQIHLRDLKFYLPCAVGQRKTVSPGQRWQKKNPSCDQSNSCANDCHSPPEPRLTLSGKLSSLHISVKANTSIGSPCSRFAYQLSLAIVMGAEVNFNWSPSQLDWMTLAHLQVLGWAGAKSSRLFHSHSLVDCYTALAWWLQDWHWGMRHGLSLAGVASSVIGWSKYRHSTGLGVIVGSHDQWEFPLLLWNHRCHWQSPCTDAVGAVQGDCERVYKTSTVLQVPTYEMPVAAETPRGVEPSGSLQVLAHVVLS